MRTSWTTIPLRRRSRQPAQTFASVGTALVYNRRDDFILCPPKHRFKEENEYYGTIFHELAHWTGHESRLNRADKLARFGDKSYAEEELVAEMGSCFTLATLGVPQTDDMSNHKAYVANWLEALNKDSRFIFRAASRSQQSRRLCPFVRPADSA